MKRSTLFLLPALFLFACASEPDPAAENHGGTDGAVPGAGAPLAANGPVETVGAAPAGEAIPVREAAARASELNGQVVRVEGTVSEVCQMAGCWLTFQTEGGVPFRVSVPKDETGQYAFTFPKDVSGATAVIEGTLAVEETDVATLRHLAEDAGQSPEEVAAITEPQQTISLTATGARITRGPVQA